MIAAGAGADAKSRALEDKETGLALANLARAVAAGFNELDRIRDNPDLMSLGGRPRFKALIEELESRRKVLVWNQDLEAAKAQAAKEKKDLFLYFGGSDWCPYDHAMRKSHLSRDEFRDYALRHFVIVEFDSPERKAKPANYPARLKLEGPWDISGCPTTVLADAHGRRYAQLAGAFTDPTADYLKQLDKLRESRVTRDDCLLRAAQARRWSGRNGSTRRSARCPRTSSRPTRMKSARSSSSTRRIGEDCARSTGSWRRGSS